MRRSFSAVTIGVVGLALVAAGCGSTGNVSSSSTKASNVGFGSANARRCSVKVDTTPNYTSTIKTVPGGAKTISGAGSTFASPMYSTWAAAYDKSNGVAVAYASIGSGGGIAAVQANTVNFGQSDSGMDSSQLAAAKGGAVLQIPVLLGADVPTYNLPGIGAGLKFTGSVLGEIYAGKIKNWDDPALKKLNPGVKLPSMPIAVVHRSDGSGTTNIWTHYLTQTSPTWVSSLGGSTKSQGLTVAWPTGIGGKGNEGVSAVVAQTKGSLGYLEADFAIANHLTYGQVQNKSGNFVEPCIATFVPAVDGVNFPPNLNTFLTNGSNPDVYPIAGTSYALVYQHQTSKPIAAGLVNFFNWVLTTGQNMNASVNYAPLGASLQKLAVDQLKKIEVNGKPVA